MNEQQEKQLNALAQADEWYQQLLGKCEAAEALYQQILQQLPSAHRDAIEAYIALCEELEYRRTCLAVIHMAR